MTFLLAFLLAAAASDPAPVTSAGLSAEWHLQDPGAVGVAAAPTRRVGVDPDCTPAGWLVGANGGRFLDNQGHGGKLSGCVVPADVTVYLWGDAPVTLTGNLIQGSVTLGYQNGAREVAASTLTVTDSRNTYECRTENGSFGVGHGTLNIDHDRFQHCAVGYGATFAGGANPANLNVTWSYFTEGGTNPKPGWHGELIHWQTNGQGSFAHNLVDVSNNLRQAALAARGAGWTSAITLQAQGAPGDQTTAVTRNIFYGATALNKPDVTIGYAGAQIGASGAAKTVHTTWTGNLLQQRDSSGGYAACTGGCAGVSFTDGGGNRDWDSNRPIRLPR